VVDESIVPSNVELTHIRRSIEPVVVLDESMDSAHVDELRDLCELLDEPE
jgi:hypothetical protein